MNNQELLQNIFNEAKELSRRIEELRDTINIDEDEYLFCSHLHHDKPRFTAWIKSLGTEDFAEFEIEDSTALVVDKGRYSDDKIQEMQAIIENWLKQGE